MMDVYLQRLIDHGTSNLISLAILIALRIRHSFLGIRMCENDGFCLIWMGVHSQKNLLAERHHRRTDEGFSLVLHGIMCWDVVRRD